MSELERGREPSGWPNDVEGTAGAGERAGDGGAMARWNDHEHPPGAIVAKAGVIHLNAGRETVELEVSNTGDRPVQVGSHYHFFEVNRALEFDRARAYGFRLDVPAGTAVRFEPGERKRVRLVALAGMRRVEGLNRLTQGSLDAVHVRRAALRRAVERGFRGADGPRVAEAGNARDGDAGALGAGEASSARDREASGARGKNVGGVAAGEGSAQGRDAAGKEELTQDAD